jgi:hypothetical protein
VVLCLDGASFVDHRLTAAICFSVASFIMSRSVKPHQPKSCTHSGRNDRTCCECILRPFRRSEAPALSLLRSLPRSASAWRHSLWGGA